MITKQYKLTPHLVPKTLWRKSAAQLFGRKGLWTQIRNDTLEAARHTCYVCSASGVALDCHEVWDYDDENGIAMLASLKALCDRCHAAVHMGRSIKHGRGHVAVAQLCKVNGIRPQQAMQLYNDAKVVWKNRNEKKWRIVVAKPLLERYPQLTALESAS